MKTYFSRALQVQQGLCFFLSSGDFLGDSQY